MIYYSKHILPLSIVGLAKSWVWFNIQMHFEEMKWHSCTGCWFRIVFKMWIELCKPKHYILSAAQVQKYFFDAISLSSNPFGGPNQIQYIPVHETGSRKKSSILTSITNATTCSRLQQIWHTPNLKWMYQSICLLLSKSGDWSRLE